MPTFLGLALLAVGAVCIVAGVQGRGAQLFTTITGKATLGTQAGTAPSVYTPGGGGIVTPAGGGTGSGVTWT